MYFANNKMLKIKTKNSEDSMGIGIESTAAVTSELVKQNKGDGDSDHSHEFDNCDKCESENLSSPETSPTR